MKKALILSDGKIGHLNQSIAFCKIKNLNYHILELFCEGKFNKTLSYIFDRLNIYTSILLNRKIEIKDREFFDVVVSTGSSTYYANRFLSRKFKSKSVVLMLPSGYRLGGFDYIIAQSHDNPPKLKNLIEIPINLSLPIPIEHFVPEQKAISLIIGGNNDIFQMELQSIKRVLDYIFEKFPNHKKAVTTSRRTPKKIEKLIEGYSFDYSVIYSKDKTNPIGDFLKYSEFVFITSDSTSMISEAVSYGNAFVEIIKLKEKRENSKFINLIKTLEKSNHLHIFDKNIKLKSKKIDIKNILKRVEI